MLSQSPDLVTIEQYPPKDNEPFLNPICKQTYKALPKIYGRKGKKKYAYNIHDIIKHEHTTIHRQCCKMEIVNTPVSQSKSNFNNSPSLSNQRTPVKILSKQQKSIGISSISPKLSKDKLEKIALPQIINSPKMLKQSQTKHKIFQSSGNRILASLFNSKLKDPILTEQEINNTAIQAKQTRSIKSQYIQTDYSVIRETDEAARNKNIQTQKIYIAANPKLRPKSTKKRHASEQKQPGSPYYEHIQNANYGKLHNSRQSQYVHRLPSRTRTSPSDDDKLSVSSSAIGKQRSVNTIFQVFSKRQGQSRNGFNFEGKETSSSIQFKVPSPQQYEKFISRYQPLDQSFDMISLIKLPDFHIVPFDGGVYFGQIKEQKREGLGVCVTSKQIYEGRFRDNAKINGRERNGQGIYKGGFKDGRRHGLGKFQWQNGEIFQGQWMMGRKNGWGQWHSPQGDRYEGEWKDNRQQGRGTFCHRGGSRYIGSFKAFLKHGRGQQCFSNGDVYSGSYENGKPHGHGKYSWATGDSYQGDFYQGSRHGQGRLELKGVIYQGEFKKDFKHGKGTQKYPNGQQFKGQFLQGQRYKGILLTSNGGQINIVPE